MSEKVSIEIWTLLEAVCNETASSEQRGRLRSLVADDSEVRRLYFEYVDVHLGCMEIVAARSAPDVPTHLRPRRRLRRTLLVTVPAGVAIAVALLIAARQPHERAHGEISSSEVPVPRSQTGGAPPHFLPEPAPPSAPQPSSPVVALPEPRGSSDVASSVPRTENLVAVLRRAPHELVASLRVPRPELRTPAGGCAVEHSTGVMNLVSGAALGDKARMDEGWAVIEATAPSARTQWVIAGDMACTARWLAWARVALEAVASSRFADTYAPRLHGVRQAVQASAVAVRGQAGASQRMRPIEAALALAGTESTSSNAEIGRALHAQTADGLFGARPACDAHLHANDVILAHALLARAPEDSVEAAARAAGDWLVRFMKPGSTGLPDKAGPDACEYAQPRRKLLRWALLLHGVRFDPASVNRSETPAPP